MLPRCARLLACLACLWAPAASAVTVIDFDSLAHSGSAIQPTPANLYEEDGFRFTADSQFSAWGTASPHYAGSAALFNDFPDEFTELVAIGGGTFTPLSIDLAENFDDSETVSVVFVGTRPDTSTVMQTFVLDGFHDGTTASFETFFFDPGFADILSLRWQQTSEFHQFDNVVIPEPASLGLVLAGLGALALRRR